ncbi:hypothetical protein MMC27_002002 [Xylographa pallens]|nr:hypothetical protein [Xylographa pallens]
MQLIKLISLLPLALSAAAVAAAGAYAPSGALAVREAEAAALFEAFEGGDSEVFAREAEAEPLENEVELDIREFKEYMRKRGLFKRVWCPDIACDYSSADRTRPCARAGCNSGCNHNNKCLAPMISGGKSGKHPRR